MIDIPGKTKEEIEQTILTVARKVAPKFKFGYHSSSDMVQQAAIFACEALANGKYDPERPLENFLYSHVVNRLINYRRDKFRRTDSPCKLCYSFSEGFTQHEDGKYCEVYTKWAKRNSAKQNIILPLNINNINYDNEANVIIESCVMDEIIENETLDIVNRRMPIELRATYLQMREGLNPPKARRDEVEEIVKQIIGD